MKNQIEISYGPPSHLVWYLQNLFGMIVHRRVVQVESLEVMKRSAHDTSGHRRFEASTKLTHMLFIVPQQNTLLIGIQKVLQFFIILKTINKSDPIYCFIQIILFYIHISGMFGNVFLVLFASKLCNFLLGTKCPVSALRADWIHTLSLGADINLWTLGIHAWIWLLYSSCNPIIQNSISCIAKSKSIWLGNCKQTNYKNQEDKIRAKCQTIRFGEAANPKIERERIKDYRRYRRSAIYYKL